MANHHPKGRTASQQPPLPPEGYRLWGQLRPAGKDSRFWWSKAEKIEKRGILVFNAEGHDFLEVEELLDMLSFLLEEATPDLIEMCGPEFLRDYAHEVEIVRIAWWSIETEKSRQFLQQGEKGE